MTTPVKPKAGPVELKPVRAGGGVYVYRTRKPMSVFGIIFKDLPWYVWPSVTAAACLLNHVLYHAWWVGLFVLLFTGRHFGYVGETVSFKDRHGEHINGGGRWKRKAQPWSDLDPKCVLRIPLPRWKWVLRSVESFLIVLLAPAYNDRKNRWNPRRIPLRSAARQRRARNGRKLPISFNFRALHLICLVVIGIVAHIVGVY